MECFERSTGLMWEDRASRKIFAQYEAVSYCNSLTSNGYSDWRMPKIRELENIWLKKSLFNNINNLSIQDSYFWAGGLARKDCWFINFSSGKTSTKHYSSMISVICVRDTRHK